VPEVRSWSRCRRSSSRRVRLLRRWAWRRAKRWRRGFLVVVVVVGVVVVGVVVVVVRVAVVGVVVVFGFVLGDMVLL
jgi:Flp pilus assembly protein TadB